MATLLKTIDEVKKYVSVNKNISFESVEPYIKQAERDYISNLTGDVLYDAYAFGMPTDATEIKVYELFREASANLAWFLYLPLANVQVSDNGISVAQGNDYKAAEWWQVRDLRRSFIDNGFKAIDKALKIMEANEDKFSPWEATEGYTIFKELFVKQTDTFNRWFYISHSRRTFLALRSYMLETHHQYFTAKLNDATIATIQTGTAANHKKVLEFLQAAQTNYTVAKVIESGSFDLTASGIYMKMEEFPGYKTKTLEQEKLSQVKRERLVAGEEFYKKAIAVIEANPTDFTDYEIKAVAEFVKPKNTKSIVSF